MADAKEEEDNGAKLDGGAASEEGKDGVPGKREQITTLKSSAGGTPELTPEVRERIRKNRERALRIQAERKRALEEQQQQEEKRRQEENSNKKLKQGKSDGASSSEGGCEEWEIGLSDWVSKKEAVAKYCLSEGTLAVCEVSTKDNPRHKGWAPMKLYRRTELRERAYKRYGGKEGLIKERTSREQKRLSKDMKTADDIFKS